MDALLRHGWQVWGYGAGVLIASAPPEVWERAAVALDKTGGCGVQYDEAMRAWVFRLLEAGTSTREIREMTGVSKSTTNRWWAERKAARAAAIRSAVQEQATVTATAIYADGTTATWTTADDVPPRAERHQETDRTRLGPVVSVVLIVGAVLAGVYFLMQ